MKLSVSEHLRHLRLEESLNYSTVLDKCDSNQMEMKRSLLCLSFIV